MTMIAFHARKSGADILTDTISYTLKAEHLDHVTKVRNIPHLDAAVAVQGRSDFGRLVDMWLSHMCEIAVTFDGLVTLLPLVLPGLATKVGEARVEDAQGDLTAVDTTPVFLALVGYSTERKTFEGWTFSSPDDYAAEQHTDVFVFPAPVGVRPARYEHSRLKGLIADERRAQADRDYVAAWLDATPAAPPRTQADWVALGQAVRRTRALADERSGIKVLVAGELHLTKLTRGQQIVKRVHEFDDREGGDEFAALVRGLAHPVSLAAPCHYCGSGATFGECHGASMVAAQ